MLEYIENNGLRYVVILLFFTIGFAIIFHEKKVPENVKKTFYKHYKDLKVDYWEQAEMSGEHRVWQAGFQEDGKNYLADIDSKGNWLATRRNLYYAEIPQIIFEEMRVNYPEFELVEALEINIENQKSFKFSLEKSGKEIEILLDHNGKLVN